MTALVAAEAAALPAPRSPGALEEQWAPPIRCRWGRRVVWGWCRVGVGTGVDVGVHVGVGLRVGVLFILLTALFCVVAWVWGCGSAGMVLW